MAPPASRDHVLILDFHDRIAGAAQDMLNGSGYTVAAPSSVDEAVEYFDQKHDEIAFVIAHPDLADTAILIQLMQPELRVFLFSETGPCPRKPPKRAMMLREATWTNLEL